MTAPAKTLVFRLPRSAYLAVLFLVFCAMPLAFATTGSAAAGISWRTLVLLVPVLAAVFIARTATFVSTSGIRVRAAFGATLLPWDEIRGLSVSDRAVYAVCVDGSLRLPCVRVNDLAAVARASDGRLPEIPEPRQKYAPSRRRR